MCYRFKTHIVIVSLPTAFTKDGNMLSFVPRTGRRFPLIPCLQRKYFL